MVPPCAPSFRSSSSRTLCWLRRSGVLLRLRAGARCTAWRLGSLRAWASPRRSGADVRVAAWLLVTRGIRGFAAVIPRVRVGPAPARLLQVTQCYLVAWRDQASPTPARRRLLVVRLWGLGSLHALAAPRCAGLASCRSVASRAGLAPARLLQVTQCYLVVGVAPAGRGLRLVQVRPFRSLSGVRLGGRSAGTSTSPGRPRSSQGTRRAGSDRMPSSGTASQSSRGRTSGWPRAPR
jgi:hypothetical protein